MQMVLLLSGKNYKKSSDFSIATFFNLCYNPSMFSLNIYIKGDFYYGTQNFKKISYW